MKENQLRNNCNTEFINSKLGAEGLLGEGGPLKREQKRLNLQ